MAESGDETIHKPIRRTMKHISAPDSPFAASGIRWSSRMTREEAPERGFGLRSRLRQRRFPTEFRIDAIAAVIPMPEPDETEPATLTEPSELDDAAVADIATNLWRILRRFDPADGAEVPKAQRLARRNVLSIAARLEDAGIRIQDHDDTPWDPGVLLTAMAYEPRPNLDRETVVETVKPSIYRSDKCVQSGEVIVGVPEKVGVSGKGSES